MLTRLMVNVQTDMSLSNISVFNWTDSEVVIAWLKGHASRWPTFVAHRVAEIQEAYPARCWSYVTSGNNPADKATRELTPQELLSDKLWWHGPPWLKLDQYQWPSPKFTENPKTTYFLVTASNDSVVADESRQKADSPEDSAEHMMSRFSSLLHLI